MKQATLRTADPRLVVRLALRLGGGVRILEPVGLAAQAAEAAQAALARYDSDIRTGSSLHPFKYRQRRVYT